ncbi:SusD/RagB family nutrient-binding outer membrane lipoprotein [Sunxiuqinia sp. sy24]|uniref:SusD/RagB family nutrient-binding outer membrane lipoprotein n=1 Tax=Sunxiuqinia sp. sy24 TaxID=3461495 RepID=UPI00404624B2
MKYSYKFLLFVLVFTACTTRDMEDVNTNINEVNDADPLYLINSSFEALFNNNSDFANLADIAYHYAGTSFPAGQYFRFPSGIWDEVYIANNNLKDAIKRTQDSNERVDKLSRAVALIFRAFGFQKLTDCYGDIPFSEAAALDENGNPVLNPKYDKQKDIYYALFNDLKTAIDLIGDESVLDLGSSDRVYNGDLQRWKKFANSLRLRMALRIRFVDETKAISVLQDVWNYPLIDSPEESAAFENWDENGYYHPQYNELKPGTRTNTSKLMVDFLKQNNDPRLPCYALPVVEGDNAEGFDGLPNGYDDVLTRANFSYAGSVTYQKDLPTLNIMYSEVCFLKAEACLFGLGVTASDELANDWYRKGIEASLKFWHREDEFINSNGELVNEFHYSEDDIDAFMASEATVLSGTDEEKFEQIAMQKWVALMTNSIEAYSEMRRTGYPAIPQRLASDSPKVHLGDTNGEWPSRVAYPDSEMLYNKENFDMAFDATNRNSMLHSVWWDVR